MFCLAYRVFKHFLKIRCQHLKIGRFFDRNLAPQFFFFWNLIISRCPHSDTAMTRKCQVAHVSCLGSPSLVHLSPIQQDFTCLYSTSHPYWYLSLRLLYIGGIWKNWSRVALRNKQSRKTISCPLSSNIWRILLRRGMIRWIKYCCLQSQKKKKI